MQTNENQNEKVVVCFSGGYDSVSLVEFLKHEGFQNENIHLLFFCHDHKAEEKEYQALKKTLGKNKGMVSRIVDIDVHHMQRENGDVYYPMRNLVFLSQAVSYAELIEAKTVAVGFVGVGEYPDTTNEFSALFNALSLLTTGINLFRPFEGITKMDVADNFLARRGGRELVLQILEDSFSCNVPLKFPTRPCGECLDCLERQEIFEKYSATPLAETDKHTV